MNAFQRRVNFYWKIFKDSLETADAIMVTEIREIAASSKTPYAKVHDMNALIKARDSFIEAPKQ